MRFVGCTLVLALALSVAACSDDSDSGSEQPAGDTTTTVAPVPAVPIAAFDYAFEGLPASLPVGGRVALLNQSPVELHEFAAFRLPDGESRTASTLVRLSDGERAALLAGGPAVVLVTPPGGEQLAVVGDGTFTAPGRYLVLCTIPTGADPQAYLDAAAAGGTTPTAVPGGAPHFTNGMFAEVNVA